MSHTPGTNDASHSCSTARPCVAVVGGGISGLAAAYRLQELAPGVRVVLLEASSRLGGVLQTLRHEDYLIEASADNFITDPPWALELAQRIGLADRLLTTRAERRGAAVVVGDRLEPVPAGFALMSPARLLPILSTRVLSPRGKLRLLAEPLIRPKRDEQDESLASFARRRLGPEAYERLVEPLVAGIYTADPERLSVRAALPRFVEMEVRYGSLWRAARHQARRRQQENTRGARYELFTAPEEGMSQLVDAIAAQLPPGTTHLGAPVESLSRVDDGRWQLRYRPAGQPGPQTLLADAVILALPAPAAGKLLEALDPSLAALLSGIEYAGCAVVVSAYSRGQLGRGPRGFGFVVPQSAGRPILAASFASEKYPHRAPEDQILVRTFLGGACRPELIDRDDKELSQIARQQLAELLRIEGPPRFEQVFRWHGKMPQYHVGHLERIGEIERRLAALPGLALAGNAYQGVGVPQCIRSGQSAAEAVCEELARRGLLPDAGSK